MTDSCEGQVGKIGANTLTVSSARQFFGGGGGEQNSYQLSQQDVNTIMYKGLSLYSGSLPDSFDPSAAAVGYSIAFPTGSNDQLTLNQMISIALGGSTSSSLTFLVKGVFSEHGSVQVLSRSRRR